MSRIRRLAASAAVTAGVVAGMAGAMSMTGVPAGATACVTTHSYAHTVTSRGSQSWTWVTKRACGRDYQKWEHRVSRSYTRAHSDEQLYRNEYAYPHYRQHEVLNSWTAKGTHTIKITNTAG